MNFTKKWGPYLSDRQWGVVREDYSPDGEAWSFTTHDQARSKAWRWGEEGIGGISDEGQFLCFAPAFWNGKDPILKERFFGLSNEEGNHGEDVKELYYYLDNAPDHRYMRMLYKYPQAAFPYEYLIEENRRRSREEPEFEIMETGAFDDNRYFDIFIEYAKVDNEDLLIKITACNRGNTAAELTLLPTIWCRNLWSFGLSDKPKPNLQLVENYLHIQHPELGEYRFYAENARAEDWLFCENETNYQRLYKVSNGNRKCKDGIHNFVVGHKKNTLNSTQNGTKAAIFLHKTIEGGSEAVFRCRLVRFSPDMPSLEDEDTPSLEDLACLEKTEAIFAQRKQETSDFYANLQKNTADEELRRIQQRAWAGMLWSKQFYYYYIPRWLNGDPGQPPPPFQRHWGRNHDWTHFRSVHILSMPDKWEYPWFAAWDLAFQSVVLARLDPAFAKDQLRTLHSGAFRRADGSLPAYEWNFDDVNPPVQAWATWRIFEIEKNTIGSGDGDLSFLTEMFEPLRAAYNWWMNQKDTDGNDLFTGGFLGLDNIGIFDRSKPLPDGGQLEQSDATAWAASYALQMLRIALELAKKTPETTYYQEQAFGFFQHFLQISYAIGSPDDQRTLWDDTDGFFYDTLRMPDDSFFPLKIRSIVGLIPLLAVYTIEDKDLASLPLFKSKVTEFLAQNPELASMISRWHDVHGEKRLLSLLRGHRTKCLLQRMLDPAEFLSDFGVRSLSKEHEKHPFRLHWLGQELSVGYLPGESNSGMFGGNSNWRGPVWMPINFLLIEALHEFYAYYSDDFKVECPVGSGHFLSFREVAIFLAKRLINLFRANDSGSRPLHGAEKRYAEDPYFKNLLLFYEYFDGDTGRGVGASHQTGWTGLVAEL